MATLAYSPNSGESATPAASGATQTAMVYSYDAMGRVANLWQCAPYNCGSASIWSMPYSYDLAGDVTGYTNPAGFTVSQQINGAQQATNLTYGSNMAVSEITYEPWGAISTICGGQGCAQSQETRQYNSRLQPVLMELGSSSNLTADYCLVYNYYKSLANPTGCAPPSQGTQDNGNIIGKYYQANADTSDSHAAAYTYDGVNRLMTAVATGSQAYNLTYSYDQYGNGTCVMNGSTQGFCPQYSYNSANNHITNTGYTYDAAGDLLWDGGSNYEYDAEGRVKHSYSTGQWQYPMYNALGQRVEDYQGPDTLTLTYPRDIFGQRTGAFAQWPSQNWTGWNVYWASVAGQRLNMGGADAYIDHSDVIGSTTMETDPAGGVQWKIAYYPWGQILAQGGIRQSVVWAGLDWQVNDPSYPSATREYNDGLGRWLTPDPGGVKVVKLDDPQTWNMYAYVGNNPTTRVDPSGLYTCVDDPKCKSKLDTAFESARQNDLKSRETNIVRSAKAYGDPTKDNGVTLQFGNPGKGEGGTTVSSLGSDAQGNLRANSLITISPEVRGSDLDALVAHEGSHALDAQTEVSRINATGSNFRQVLNIHERESEVRGYGMTNAVLAGENVTRSFCAGDCKLGAGVPPWEVRESIDKILGLPPYNLGPGDQGPLIIPLPPEQ